MIHARKHLCAIGLAVLSPLSWGEDAYPAKPIHFVVPFSPGGESDIVARRIASKLAALRGYTVLVDNFPGAGGNLGAERALREPADGYTFLVISGAYAANAVVSKSIAKAVDAIRPVIQFTSQPAVVVGSVKYASIEQLLDKARKAPGTVTYGSAGIGSLGQFTNENLAMVTGVKLNHIPYKGTSGAVSDLAGGQIDMLMSGVTAATALAKGGKIHLLAITSAKRLPELPDIPTLQERGIPYESSLWHGLVASNKVPAVLVDKMNADLNAVLRDPEIVGQFKADMLTPVGGTPGQFQEVLAKEFELLKRVAKAANIQAQ